MKQNGLIGVFMAMTFFCKSQTEAILLNNTFRNVKEVVLDGRATGKLFEGIGVVNGGGATAVLLKDYREPQRSQILDLLYKPNFGASVSALLVEIPGDGNATQGSMPSHMHTKNDLNYSRGYIWWILQEAKKRNPKLSLDATAWSAPGWIGNGRFGTQDAADYYVKWLQGLKNSYGLELDAIGCRNEKGYDYNFAKILRTTLNQNGFQKIRLHAFDHWPKDKLHFVKDLLQDTVLRNSIDIISAHVFYANEPASKEDQAMAAAMQKPIWNTEDHIYKKGFDCLISIVESFNRNYLESGATRIVNWYDIAGIYPIEPYAEDPATILAYWPWSGHYKVRESLWGYAHYGQFTQIGWKYLQGDTLVKGGSFVSLVSPEQDYSIILETKKATEVQHIRFRLRGGLSPKDLCVWRSNEKEQFVQLADIKPVDSGFLIIADPNSVYSISTKRGQQKGGFKAIPPPKRFPFPYRETFEQYKLPEEWGYLPHYTADIADAFEIVERPDKKGKCLQQVVPIPTISWAPDWHPYTIIGDSAWKDYQISTEVFLKPGDTAAVMGRINHVGTGYGFIPKGYYLQLGSDGTCALVLIRGKKDKKKLTGDAEQQALIRRQQEKEEGGVKVLATTHLPNFNPNRWHQLTLRFEGTTLTGLVDGQEVMQVIDSLYSAGMAGLMALGDGKKLSTPYYDNLWITTKNGAVPLSTQPIKGLTPIYRRNHIKQ